MVEVALTWKEWWDQNVANQLVGPLTDDSLIAVQYYDEGQAAYNETLVIAKSESVAQYIRDKVVPSIGNTDDYIRLRTTDGAADEIVLRCITKSVTQADLGTEAFEFSIEAVGGSEVIKLKFDPSNIDINELGGNLGAARVAHSGTALDTILDTMFIKKEIEVSCSEEEAVLPLLKSLTKTFTVGVGDAHFFLRITNGAASNAAIIVEEEDILLPEGLTMEDGPVFPYSVPIDAFIDIKITVNTSAIRDIEGVLYVNTMASSGKPCIYVNIKVAPSEADADPLIFRTTNQYMAQEAITASGTEVVGNFTTADPEIVNSGHDSANNRMFCRYGDGGAVAIDHQRYQWIFYKKTRGKLSSITLGTGTTGDPQMPADYQWHMTPWEVVHGGVTYYAYRTINQITNFGNAMNRMIIFNR